MVAPIAWRDDALELLDQTRLPAEEHWLRCTTADDVADAIPGWPCAARPQ